MVNYGPCASGSYCYPVFTGGYKQVFDAFGGFSLVGQGNINGFICNAAPKGMPGEKFWSGACPGTWGPSGPFYPTKSASPAGFPKQCTPPKGPSPGPDYHVVWTKSFICQPPCLGRSPYVAVWTGHWVKKTNAYKTPPDCPCTWPMPTSPAGGGSGGVAKGPISPSPQPPAAQPPAEDEPEVIFAPPAEYEDEPIYAGSVFLSQVIPPDAEKIGGMPRPGAHLLQAEPAIACTCDLKGPGDEDPPTPQLVDGFRNSPDGKIGVCPTIEQTACAYNETVTLEFLSVGDVEGDAQFFFTSRLRHRRNQLGELKPRSDDEKNQPFEIRLLDPKAADSGVRTRAEPDGETREGVPRKWANKDWEDTQTLKEPCESSPPMRLVVKLSNDKDVRAEIGNMLYKDIEERVKNGETPASARGNARLEAVVQVRTRSGGDMLCEYDVPIVLRGGIWVMSIEGAEGNSDLILQALRRLWTPPSGGTAPFDWVDGIPPASRKIGQIVPTAGFPTTPPTETEPKGRQLLYKMFGGTCCAIIMQGGPDAWTPFNPDHAFPDDYSDTISVQHWKDKIVDCDGKEAPGRSEGEKYTVHGTGLGVGGVVKITGEVIRGQFKDWTLWQPSATDATWRVIDKKNNRAGDVSLARVLAHELAHLVQGCAGESTVGSPITKPLEGTLRDSAGVERTWTAGKNDLGNQGEYDAIIDWENPIAIELRELPRFKHG